MGGGGSRRSGGGRLAGAEGGSQSRDGGGRLAGGLRRRPSRGGWEVEALAGAEAGGLLERRAARSRAMEGRWWRSFVPRGVKQADVG